MMQKTLAVLLFALCPSLSAQTPYLVKDINTTIPTQNQTSEPAAFLRYGNRVYFSATTPREGTELWSTDETAAGTNLVADFLPELISSGATPFAVVNGVFLFTALDVDHGFELWTTDGTADGTHLFKDINPGPSSADVSGPFLYRDRLLFVADDGTNGRELWTSDGTPAGTQLVKDLNSDSAGSSPADLTQMNGVVYFSAPGGLWQTDGTEAGTMKVAGGVAVRHLAAAGNRLFFEGSDAKGSELWTSDGTESGTRMFVEIRPGSQGAFNPADRGFAVLGDRVVFAANDGSHGRELWGSDGTTAGTLRLKNSDSSGSSYYDFTSWAVLGGRVFFCATDPQHGVELWSSDGTVAGTALLKDLNPGSGSSSPRGLTVSGGKLFFGSGGSQVYQSGTWVWVSDGTSAGTHILVGADASAPLAYAEKPFWPVDGKVFFGGSDVFHGVEPWVSDGTDSGTRIIANLAAEDVPSSYPGGLTAAGNLVFFIATENALPTAVNQRSLWRTDGSVAGTFKLLEGVPKLLAAGPWALFERSGPVRWWRSDGTAEGTRAADDFAKLFGGHYSIEVAPIGETIFVSVFDYKPDVRSLWKTTAAPGAPAIRLADRALSQVIEIAGRYFFYSEANPGAYHQWGLWTTDGTPEGTHAIVPQLRAAEGGVEVSRLVSAGGTIYFLLRPPYGSDMMLYRSDGTFAGTTVLKTVPRTSRDLVLTTAGRKVFFAGDRSLWVSDGTESGTIELGKFDWTYSNGPMNAGDRVVFDPYTNHGSELWTSDGTPEGTRTLRKSDLRTAASIDGTIYFVGKDAEHGEEPWTTDGTPEGTKMVVDLNPGPASSSPSQFTKSGDLIYFSARTEQAGYELWALPLPSPRLSISDVRVAEGGPSRFTISLTSPAKQGVTVDYATSDGTARAGDDYDAAAGTLTFAPGETTKSVEVRVRGDLVDEGNENFFVTLRNPSGATIAKREGFAVIENDDQSVDLSLAPDFADGTFDLVTVSNNGPRAATDVVVSVTMTPPSTGDRCSVCTVPPLSPGALTSIATASSGAEATYVSAKVSARQPDSRPADNAAGWVVSGKRLMAMNRLFLNPGDVAQVTIANRLESPVALRSFDPSVVSVGVPAIDFPNAAVKSMTFSIGAHKAGTASIIADPFQDALPIIVTEFPTTPRWPGGVTIAREGPSSSRFDSPIVFLAKPAGTAPFTGATATGTIAVSAAGHELAHRPLNTAVSLFPTTLGPIRYEVTYSGDANFAPQTLIADQFVSPGFVTLTGSLERTAGEADTFVLRVHAKGSPAVPPTGTIAVMNGATLLATLTLTASGDESTASATLSNLPASPALTLQYSGDAFHAPSTQEIRVVETRRRSVGH